MWTAGDMKIQHKSSHVLPIELLLVGVYLDASKIGRLVWHFHAYFTSSASYVLVHPEMSFNKLHIFS